ncbi:MAG: Clp protease N-terminal domain-containing protein [Planctomycetota bacterium]
MLEGFSEHGQEIQNLAREELASWGHEILGTEHLLLGWIRLGRGWGRHLLVDLGVDLDELRDAVERTMTRGSAEGGVVAFTPGARRALELAHEESVAAQHDYIGSEHLILGLLGEQEGVAARALMAAGLQLESLRAEVQGLYRNTGAAPARTFRFLGDVDRRIPEDALSTILYVLTRANYQVGPDDKHPNLLLAFDLGIKGERWFELGAATEAGASIVLLLRDDEEVPRTLVGRVDELRLDEQLIENLRAVLRR